MKNPLKKIYIATITGILTLPVAYSIVMREDTHTPCEEATLAYTSMQCEQDVHEINLLHEFEEPTLEYLVL